MRFAILPLIFIAYVSQAQENFAFHHLTSKDGLGSDYMLSVLQDSIGFYCLGTSSRLQKFDGYNFSNPLKADKDLLSSPIVTETNDGTLWISCENSK